MKGNKMIAIDWSHIKDLTTYDGEKARVETIKTLLSRMAKESRVTLKSIGRLHFAVLEQGCPLSLMYQLTSHGVAVKLIDNHATEAYRKEYNIEKTDENDAKIIHNLGNNGAVLREVTWDDQTIQMQDLYHQYCRFQKARVAMQNMRKAHLRHYGLSGDGESITYIKSKVASHPSPDLSPYDIAIDVLHGREKSLIKQATKLVGGESKRRDTKSTIGLQPPTIKGLGDRIWLGIMVTANPTSFKCLSAYLRFCGLTDDVMKSHKYNRHAKMLYHMLAESVMKKRDPIYRPIYDKCKADIAEKHPDYKKGHIHNAALNRTATFLAKAIFNKLGAVDERQ